MGLVGCGILVSGWVWDLVSGWVCGGVAFCWMLR